MFRAAAIFLLAFCLGIAPAQAQQATPAKAVRVLFVGNSLTFWSDIPKRVGTVCAATGRKVEIESVAFPAYSLEDHWRDGRALAAIKKGWDIVVLQQGVSASDIDRTELVEYTRRFAEPIRAAGAKLALYEVWPLSDRPKEFPEVIKSHRLAAEGSGAMIIPVGEAWLRALNKDRHLKLYSDGIHPSSLGSDLATLTIYLSLFPAGPQEFDDAFVTRVANALEMPESRRDLFFDSATLAIDSPLAIQ